LLAQDSKIDNHHYILGNGNNLEKFGKNLQAKVDTYLTSIKLVP
jgi:hypothetical protein